MRLRIIKAFEDYDTYAASDYSGTFSLASAKKIGIHAWATGASSGSMTFKFEGSGDEVGSNEKFTPIYGLIDSNDNAKATTTLAGINLTGASTELYLSIPDTLCFNHGRVLMACSGDGSWNIFVLAQEDNL